MLCDKLLRILEFICTNKEEILERELSMMILDGSKEFEDHYRTRVCKVLSKYLDFSELLEGIDDTRERQKIILEEFQIYTNPSYIYLKGKYRNPAGKWTTYPNRRCTDRAIFGTDTKDECYSCRGRQGSHGGKSYFFFIA
ncbi:MAG: hypothetical protein ACLU80_02705 [Dorea sp.]